MTPSALTSLQKRSVFKIAVDLVKADSQIHKNEVVALRHLHESLGLSQEEIDMVHYLTLQEALQCIGEVDEGEQARIMQLYDSLMCVDNDIDFDENLLIAATRSVLGKESGSWCRVLSVSGLDAAVPSRQIVYLEDEACAAAHAVLDEPYDALMLSKTFQEVGLDFFYLPAVLRRMQQRWGKDEPMSQYDILRQSMGYMAPMGENAPADRLDGTLPKVELPTFSRVVLSNWRIPWDQIPFRAFLLLKIRESYVLDDENVPKKTVDFLCVDMGADVRQRILSLVGLLDTGSLHISYEGYYRILYDCLGVATTTMSHVLLSRDGEMLLRDLGNAPLRFESAPQAKTFYLLLLRYGAKGIRQDLFDAAVELLEKGPFALDESDEASVLVYDTMQIYGFLSGKDRLEEQFQRYVRNILRHRSSLKTYVNTGFAAMESLAGREQYMIRYDAESRRYHLTIGTGYFFYAPKPDAAVPLTEAPFWRALL